MVRESADDCIGHLVGALQDTDAVTLFSSRASFTGEVQMHAVGTIHGFLPVLL